MSITLFWLYFKRCWKRKLIYTFAGVILVSTINATLGDIMEPIAVDSAVKFIFFCSVIIAAVETLYVALLPEDLTTIVRKAFEEQYPTSGKNPNNPL